MKKLSIAFAVVLAAIVASCGNGTPKADIKNDIDTLSYAFGMAQSTGLKGYLVQRLGVDTAYIDEFIKGLNDGANAGDDKKKVAYYAGIQIGQQISQQMVKGINYELFEDDSTKTISLKNFMAGFVSGTLEKDEIMSHEEAQEIFQIKMGEIKRAQLMSKYGDWKDENDKYLANIATQEGVQKLSDGVYYKVITEGSGAVPADTNRVSVHYEGKLINDTVFDSSYKRGEPIKIRCNQVVVGWKEALCAMPVGSKWEVYIGADKAYGERQAGDIMPFSTLVFTMELLGIE